MIGSIPKLLRFYVPSVTAIVTVYGSVWWKLGKYSFHKVTVAVMPRNMEIATSIRHHKTDMPWTSWYHTGCDWCFFSATKLLKNALDTALTGYWSKAFTPQLPWKNAIRGLYGRVGRGTCLANKDERISGWKGSKIKTTWKPFKENGKMMQRAALQCRYWKKTGIQIQSIKHWKQRLHEERIM